MMNIEPRRPPRGKPIPPSYMPRGDTVEERYADLMRHLTKQERAEIAQRHLDRVAELRDMDDDI